MQLLEELNFFRNNMKIPNSLHEAHEVLEQSLSEEDLSFIDLMDDEHHMCKFHFNLGRYIRNNWDIWVGGTLRNYMNGLGFYHPDDISAVILGTFWCKRHGKSFDLESRAAYYKKYWEESPKI